MLQYPTLPLNPKTQEVIAEIAFKEAEAANTKEALEGFLAQYPESKHKKQAEDKLKKIK